MANKNGGLNNTRPTFTNVNNVYQQEKTVTKAYHQSTTNIGEDFFKTEKNYFCWKKNIEAISYRGNKKLCTS